MNSTTTAKTTTTYRLMSQATYQRKPRVFAEYEVDERQNGEAIAVVTYYTYANPRSQKIDKVYVVEPSIVGPAVIRWTQGRDSFVRYSHHETGSY